jgi:hypothetical protein
MKTRTLFAIVVAIVAAAAALAQTAVPLPQPGNVSLPLDEYNRLKELAANTPKKAEEPPMAFIIQSADCKLRVTGLSGTPEALTGTVQLDGVVLRKGPIKAALVTGMTVLDARLSGKSVPLVQENGTHSAVLEGPGEFSLTLDAAMPLILDPGRARFNFPAPAAGAVRLSLTIPGEHTDVTLNQGLIASRTSNGGHTVIEATLVPGQMATILWSVRTAAPPPAPPKELRFLSDVKTLVTVNDGEITLASLIDITVIQGDTARFELEAPAGYEITGADGPTLQKSEARPGGVILYVNPLYVNSAGRSHQFLVSMSKTDSAGKLDVAMPGMQGAQRETGEALVEGVGTLELTAAPRGGLRRSDVKEASATLRSLTSHPAYAAFRYQRKPAETPGLALEWTRFPDAAEVAAIAQRAEVTTLVTREGRSLTEVKLTLKNQSQPFVKVDLPADASILSAEVAGEKVKPVEGPDGNRVPLLRPGFRPIGAYTVSFVFLHSGAPFTKKGTGALALPKMDVPVGVVQWEVFLPKQYAVAAFGGDAIPANLMPAAADLDEFAELRPGNSRMFVPPTMSMDMATADDSTSDTGAAFVASQLEGRVVDSTGHSLSDATVLATSLATGATVSATADSDGVWVLNGMPLGQERITVSAPKFQSQAMVLDLRRYGGFGLDTSLQVGSSSQTVDVGSDALMVVGSTSSAFAGPGGAAMGNLRSPSSPTGGKATLDQATARQQAATSGTSQNVLDLQKRVAGVLPIAVNVPHAGNSYRFVRPLVVAEETRVTFNYKIAK